MVESEAGVDRERTQGGDVEAASERERQLADRLAQFDDRLARVEALTDALAGSRVLRLARLVRGRR